MTINISIVSLEFDLISFLEYVEELKGIAPPRLLKNGYKVDFAGRVLLALLRLRQAFLVQFLSFFFQVSIATAKNLCRRDVGF